MFRNILSCRKFVVIHHSLINFFTTDMAYVAYPPVLLHRRADILRKAMDTEKGKKQYREIRTPFEVQERHWKRLMARTLGRPFKLFALEPILQLFGTYIAFIYGLSEKIFSTSKLTKALTTISISRINHSSRNFSKFLRTQSRYRRTALHCTGYWHLRSFASQRTGSRQNLSSFYGKEWRYRSTRV